MDGFVLFLGLLAICLILLGYVVITRRGRSGKASADKPSMVNEKHIFAKRLSGIYILQKCKLLRSSRLKKRVKRKKSLPNLTRTRKAATIA